MAATRSDQTKLSSITTTAQALAGLVLVSPQSTIGYQPLNPPDFVGPDSSLPPALLFHYEGEQSINLQAEITDHYTEANSAVQDQIALRPETFTVHGFIGELNNVPPYGLQTLKQAADKLGAISAYTPALSVTALKAYNEAFFAYQLAATLARSAISTWDFVTGAGGENVIDSSGLGDSFNAKTGKIKNSQNRQQTAFQQFYGYYRAKTLFRVQTPWCIFENMAIQSLRVIQDEGTSQISDFEVTFKMIRFAKLGSDLAALVQGQLKAQGADLVDNGTSSPTAAESLGDKISAMFT